MHPVNPLLVRGQVVDAVGFAQFSIDSFSWGTGLLLPFVLDERNAIVPAFIADTNQNRVALTCDLHILFFVH